MKTLYNTIQESLLSDIDTTLARGEHDIILSRLFNNNLQQRRDAFNDLLLMVESYHPKQHKTTVKMKNSDSYFVEFTYPIGIDENGELIGFAFKFLKYSILSSLYFPSTLSISLSKCLDSSS